MTMKMNHGGAALCLGLFLAFLMGTWLGLQVGFARGQKAISEGPVEEPNWDKAVVEKLVPWNNDTQFTVHLMRVDGIPYLVVKGRGVAIIKHDPPGKFME